MASVEQQMQALNLQLSESNAQIGLMSLALDNLRNESGMAIQELRRVMAEAKSVDDDRRTRRSPLSTSKYLREEDLVEAQRNPSKFG